MPIGAPVVAEEGARRRRGSHHSTFGGNPLACAAGRAALEVIVRERLAERAERLGVSGRHRGGSLSPGKGREVGGLGLWWGIELRAPVAPYLAALDVRGFLALSVGVAVLRLLPPLVISEEDWTAGLAAIEEVVGRG